VKRRHLLQLAGGALATHAAAATDRPNVLLIISGQIHHQALGVAGNPIIRTPNIDRLAREGVRFTHAVCPMPFRSSSRASMLSGLYPHKQIRKFCPR
jgi:arylsulfatase A-like enzyme